MPQFAYAIIPDGLPEPTALFDDLQDAVDWALERYGGDRFTVRGVQMRAMPPQEVSGPS